MRHRLGPGEEAQYKYWHVRTQCSIHWLGVLWLLTRSLPPPLTSNNYWRPRVPTMRESFSIINKQQVCRYNSVLKMKASTIPRRSLLRDVIAWHCLQSGTHKTIQLCVWGVRRGDPECGAWTRTQPEQPATLSNFPLQRNFNLGGCLGPGHRQPCNRYLKTERLGLGWWVAALQPRAALWHNVVPGL